MTEIELYINRYYQNKLTITEIMGWFYQFELSKQKEICSKLTMFLYQTQPSIELITQGIQLAPIKETMTPVVLFKTKPFNIAVKKINDLPDDELKKSFIIMLSIFKVTDTARRETDCKNGCTHDWHNIIAK